MDFSKYLGSLASGAQKSYGGLLSGLSAPSLSLPLQKPAQPVAPATPTSSPSASNPAPTSITSPTSSPAKQQYMSSLAGSSGTAQTGTNNPPADSGSTVPPYLQPGYKSPGQLADEKISAGQQPNNADGTPPAIPLPTDPMSSYVQYLKTYQDKANTANTDLADIQTKQEQAQTDARRGYNATLDTAGGTQGGNQAAATQLDRRNNANLADIALQESAAARTAGVAQTALGNAKPLQIGDNFYDPATGKLIPNTKAAAGFSLSPGEVRYEQDPTTGQYKAVSTNGSASSTYQAGADPTVDSWVKQVQNGLKITDVPKQYQDQVSQATSQMTPPVSQTTRSTINLIDSILGRDTGPVTGLLQLGSHIPGTDAALTKNYINQLSGMLSLANRTQLKGSGAISDFEAKTLEKAASALGVDSGGSNLSNDDFRKVLNDLKTTLAGQSSQSSNTALTAAEQASVMQMRADGLPDDVIEQVLNKPLSFNSVGNTSVSIPQSSRLAYVNNNPGNLKFSNQPGATQGEGGFAKFSSPEAGAKALSDQIQLDASRGLTLSQFVTKFAPPTENMTGQYIKQVASMVGVDPLTPLKNIDLKALTKAFAQKESSTNIA